MDMLRCVIQGVSEVCLREPDESGSEEKRSDDEEDGSKES